jgi:hypothetical protein
MATAGEVLAMLRPNGGYVMTGDDYSGIEFIECQPFTEKEFKDGFAKVDAWLADETAKKVAARKVILDRLGITAEEAAILVG